MKTGFKNIEEPKPYPKSTPNDGKKSPWDFRCPPYDERSSCYVNAGTEYGVGHKSPIGKFSASSKSPIPKGRIATLKVDEKAR